MRVVAVVNRWKVSDGQLVEAPEIDAFLNEVVAVCERHGFSLSHEDSQGAFLVEQANEDNFNWLRAAQDAR